MVGRLGNAGMLGAKQVEWQEQRATSRGLFKTQGTLDKAAQPASSRLHLHKGAPIQAAPLGPSERAAPT